MTFKIGRGIIHKCKVCSEDTEAEYNRIFEVIKVNCKKCGENILSFFVEVTEE